MTELLVELFEANGAQRIQRDGGHRDGKDLWGAAFNDIGSAVKAIVAVSIGAGGDMEACLRNGKAVSQRTAQDRLYELEALQIHALGDDLGEENAIVVA